MSILDILQQKKLDYGVVSKPICLKGTQQIDGIPVVGSEIESHVATVRQDTGAVLGIVGNKYRIIQNVEAFGIADHLDGDVKSAQAIDGGRIVAVTMDIGRVDLNDDPDEDLRKQIFLRTSHDGSCSLEARIQVLRIICTNGLTAWHKKAVVKIRHTESYQDKIREARRILGIAGDFYRKLSGAFNRMIETPITAQGQKDFLDKLIGEADPNKKRDCITPVRERILHLLHHSRDLRKHQHNAWGLYNATTAYVDHIRGQNSSADNQFAMRNWGTGYDLKNKAFDLLTVKA